MCLAAEPPLESVVEGIRPFDGKSYSDMIRQLKELLQSPDIEDTSSAPRRRLEELISAFRLLYATKVGTPGRPCTSSCYFIA